MLVKWTGKNQQPKVVTYAQYKLSVIEKRLLYLIINQLKTGFDVDKDLFDNNVFRIPVSKLGDTNYNRIKKAADQLTSRKIEFEDKEKGVFDVLVAVPRFRYHGDEGMIQLTINREIMPYFLELSEGYEEYQLQAALDLSSFYSQRIYEMLSGYKDTGYLELSIPKLRELLNAEDKYTEISMFRKGVLDVAKREVNEKTDIRYKYELHKTGRKFTDITFHIEQQPHKNIYKGVDSEGVEVEKNKRKRTKEYLDKFGVHKAEHRKKIIYQKQDEFWKWLKYYKQNREKISNPAGHLLTTLGLVEGKKQKGKKK